MPQFNTIVFLLLLVSPSSSFVSWPKRLLSKISTTASKFEYRVCMVRGDGDTSNCADDSVTIQQQRKPLFAGFDLGTSGCRISIIEELPSSPDGFREVYNDSISWKDCVRSPRDSNSNTGHYDDAESWWIAIEKLFKGCSPSVMESIASIAVSGTSASCLIADRTTLEVTRKPRMYDYDVVNSGDSTNDTSGIRAMQLLQKHLPPKHTALSQTGSFAKLVKWILQSPLERNEFLCHQSDYISTKLIYSIKDDSLDETSIQFQSHSDWQNCLKLGYDVQNLCWPLGDWMESCLREAMEISDGYDEERINSILPTKVGSPGAPIGIVNEKVAKNLGLSNNVIVVSGTTDSNAAFYAAAAKGSALTSSNNQSDHKISIPYGTAVTSLGSTTAIKFLSKTYIEDSTLGVYSHRFPMRDIFATATSDTVDDEESNYRDANNSKEEAWLVGGASNVGCAVFRALNFTDEELENRSKDIDPTTDSISYLRYKYYPLLPDKVGERFPLADATKKSILDPLPNGDGDENSVDRTEYLKGLFQSIATEVERKGYEVLRDLGASPPFPTQIMTAGGGSKNAVWTSLRQRIINESIDSKAGTVEVTQAKNSEASYGAALLAAAGFRL